MNAASTVDEARVEEAFRQDPRLGLELIHRGFRDQITRHIQTKGLGLSPDEVADVYQDTMLEMTAMVDAGQFDSQRPLPLAYAIAGKRAIDAWRRKRHREATNQDAVLPLVVADPSDNELNQRSRDLDGETWTRFRQALMEVIAELPSGQQVVARAFVRHCELLRERNMYAPLCDAVRRATRQPTSVGSVKNAWRRARKTIVVKLARRGFDFFESR